MADGEGLAGAAVEVGPAVATDVEENEDVVDISVAAGALDDA